VLLTNIIIIRTNMY